MSTDISSLTPKLPRKQSNGGAEYLHFQYGFGIILTYPKIEAVFFIPDSWHCDGEMNPELQAGERIYAKMNCAAAFDVVRGGEPNDSRPIQLAVRSNITKPRSSFRGSKRPISEQPGERDDCFLISNVY